MEGVKVDVVRPVRRDNGNPAQARQGTKRSKVTLRKSSPPHLLADWMWKKGQTRNFQG